MYFGSVRFFKNMILLCVIIMILIPTVFAIRLSMSLTTARAEVRRLDAEITQIRQQVDEHIEEDVEEAHGQPEFTAEGPAYQQLYPDFYAPQPLQLQESEEHMVYLTFDDGPTGNTDAVLDVLAEQDVKATFFVIGTTGQAAGERMRNIVKQGHTLGMHSYSHEFDTIYASVEEFLGDMYQIFSIIREETGVTPTVFRFPGGSINAYNPGVYQEIIAEMLRRGFVPHDWNISAQDATSRGLTVEELVENVTGKLTGKMRAIVLMHDGARQDTTVKALPVIIDRFRALGFQFDRISPNTKPVLFSYME